MGSTCFCEKSILVKDKDNNIKVKYVPKNNQNENNNIENIIINNQNIKSIENKNDNEYNKNENKNNIIQYSNNAQPIKNNGIIKDDNDFIKQKEVNPYIREISIDQMQIIKVKWKNVFSKLNVMKELEQDSFAKFLFLIFIT